MADYGIQLGKVVFVALLSVILTIDVIVGLQALYYWQLNRAETSEDLYMPSAKLESSLNAQRTQLTDYRMVDAEKGIVSIPIKRAMELVVAEQLLQSGAMATPREDAPMGDMPMGGMPTGGMPTGNTPPGNTPPGNTPRGNAPGGDTP